MNLERNLEKLSKAELISLVEKLQKKARKPTEKPSNLVEKLQKKARKPNIAIVDNGQVPQPIAQPQKTSKHIRPKDPNTGRFVKIHLDRPKPPKQPALPRLRDAKGRFISRRQSQPTVEQPPLQMQNTRIKPQKPTRKPPLPPPMKEHITNVLSCKIKELNRALKGHTKSYGIELQDNLNSLNHFTFRRPIENHERVQFIETLEVTFEKETIDSKTGKRVSIYKTAFFNGKSKTITKANDTKPELSMSRQEILNVIKKWVSEGSGWVIDRIDSHYINVTTYQPLHGSSYVELPTKLRNQKKGLIKIKSKDNECFRWCHIRHLNPQKKDPQRIKKEEKQFIGELNYKGIEFPVSQKQYNKIERKNSIRINVFGYEKGQPFPIHISKEKFEDQMNLLLITRDEKKHHVLIKDFNTFMYNQSKHKNRKHFCMYCLQCFPSERILANHVNNCLTINGKQAINMSKKGENILKFNSFHKQLPVPFVIYADFEAITKKVQGCKQSEEMEKEKEKRSYTEAYQTHEDCGYGYKVVCCYKDKYSKPIQTCRGENAVYKFMERILEEVEYCKGVVKKRFNKPLVMTEDDEMCFKIMDKCLICDKEYTDKDVRVRDHCHITGKFRGSAHQEIN